MANLSLRIGWHHKALLMVVWCICIFIVVHGRMKMIQNGKFFQNDEADRHNQHTALQNTRSDRCLVIWFTSACTHSAAAVPANPASVLGQTTASAAKVTGQCVRCTWNTWIHMIWHVRLWVKSECYHVVRGSCTTPSPLNILLNAGVTFHLGTDCSIERWVICNTKKCVPPHKCPPSFINAWFSMYVICNTGLFEYIPPF